MSILKNKILPIKHKYNNNNDNNNYNVYNKIKFNNT